MKRSNYKKKSEKKINTNNSAEKIEALTIEAIEAFIHGNIDKAYEIIKQPIAEDPRKTSEYPDLGGGTQTIAQRESENKGNLLTNLTTNQERSKRESDQATQTYRQAIEDLLRNEGLPEAIDSFPDTLYNTPIATSLCTEFQKNAEDETRNKKLIALCKICLIQEQFQAFESVYARAISRDRSQKILFIENAGTERLNCGDNNNAREIYEYLARLDNKNSSYVNDIGLTYYREGDNIKAVDYFDKAIKLNAENLYSHHNRALAYHNLKDYEKAERGYHRALSCLPTYVWSYTNLARLLEDVHRLDESEQYHRLSLATSDGGGVIQENFGGFLQRRHRFQEAINHYNKAIEHGQTDHAMKYHIGHCQIGIGEYNNAIETWVNCLTSEPTNSSYAFQCGWVHNRARKYQKAIEYYAQASKLDPSNLSCYSNCLYLSNFSGQFPVEREFEFGVAWEKNYKDLNPGSYLAKYDFERKPLFGRKLKVGFITAELGNHAIAYFLKPVLHNLDKEKYELYGYDTANRDESKTQDMRSQFSVVRDVHAISDEEACNLIRNDELDILFETTSHMRSNRMGVLLRRAAPIQAHTIGYHGTSGISQLDYFIGDAVVTPAKNQEHFLEKIYQLNRTWVCYDIDEAQALPDISWSNANRLIRLGCFNNLEKVSDECLENWAQVLLKLSQSNLVLKDGMTNADVVRERIISGLARHGISEERIEWTGYVASWKEHMELYNTIDVALDTHPLNSGTTAFDALAMGVPIVSLPGDRMGSLLTTSILTGLGKRDWIATSASELVEKTDYLVSIQSEAERKSLRQLYLNSMLCNGKNMGEEFGKAMDSMTKAWHQEKRELC